LALSLLNIYDSPLGSNTYVNHAHLDSCAASRRKTSWRQMKGPTRRPVTSANFTHLTPLHSPEAPDSVLIAAKVWYPIYHTAVSRQCAFPHSSLSKRISAPKLISLSELHDGQYRKDVQKTIHGAVQARRNSNMHVWSERACMPGVPQWWKPVNKG
jgi:hypothetical protein